MALLKSNVNKKTKRKKNTFYFIVLFFLVYFLILIYKNISSSVFIKRKDRVNVVFYSNNTSFFSFSKKDVNYIIEFPPETEVLVPGGYGSYKLGSLGKLVSLEKNPDLFKKTFSAATSTFVDLYFYPRKVEIYYQADKRSYFPKISEIVFSKSNSNFLDRLILIGKLFDKNQSNYKTISIFPKLFNREEFIKDFQGSFYKRAYRDKQATVQILYKKSYSTALLLSQMIDGEGIRVVDLSTDEKNPNKCLIITKKIDLIDQALVDFFHCQLKEGETVLSDIIIKLGNLEKEWAVH